MKHTITLIPGDGIGPEVSAAVVRIIEAAGVDIQWETHYAGAQALEKFGDTLPQDLLESIKRNKIALKGPITTPVGKGFTSVNVGLRKTLDLYANLRPVRALPNVPSRYPELDLVVVRENTEDLYSGIEHVVVPGVVESIKIITEKASTRIARFAFEYARRENRKKVTAVHKANIMKLSDGLFLDCFRNVSKDYPEIEADDKIVDNACMQLVMRPEQFDIMLLENLYGDIVSDLCAGLIGGLGLSPRREHRRAGRSLRGSAWQRAGHRRARHRQPDRLASKQHPDAQTHRRTRGRPEDRGRHAQSLQGRKGSHTRHRRRSPHGRIRRRHHRRHVKEMAECGRAGLRMRISDCGFKRKAHELLFQSAIRNPHSAIDIKEFPRSMKTTVSTAAACLLFVCLLSVTISAQQSSTATLSGIITDPNGALIVGAEVTATQKATGVQRETTTNDQGLYTLTNLSPGEYEVKVVAAGFAMKVYQALVVLQVGQNVTVDAVLEVGQPTHAVYLPSIPLIDTLSSKVDSVVDKREIASLPLNGRNFLELALLVPGNSPAPNFDPTKTNTVVISSAGQLGRGGNITVDGVDNNDDVVGGPLQNIPQEAVQEFQIATNRFSAEYGRSASSVINIVTKAGTNETHGAASVFFRDRRFQGLPATFDRSSAEEPPFDRQQYSFAMGGPIVKDKAWYFGALEYRNQDGAVLVGARDISRRTITRGFAPAPLNLLLLTLRGDWHPTDKDGIISRYSLERGDDVSASTLDSLHRLGFAAAIRAQ